MAEFLPIMSVEPRFNITLATQNGFPSVLSLRPIPNQTLPPKNRLVRFPGVPREGRHHYHLNGLMAAARGPASWRPAGRTLV